MLSTKTDLKKDVLFIYSARNSTVEKLHIPGQCDIQFGISYISALLKKNGFTTDLLILSESDDWRKILQDTVRNTNPRLVAFTSVFSEYDFVAQIASHIKQVFPSVFSLIGGTHATLNPDVVIHGPFDALCIGEGEWPTLELIQQLQQEKPPSGIENLWIKTPAGIEKNAPRAFLQEIDCLPFADREIWQPWIKDRTTLFSILAGRGCPFLCAYCCNHALKNVSSGKYVRLRKPEKIIEELDWLSSRFPEMRTVYFEVETIGIRTDYITDFCEQLRRYCDSSPKDLQFGVNLRITPHMNFDLIFSSLSRARFSYVKIGLESGSEHVRSESLNRHYSNEDIFRAVQTAKTYNIKVDFYVMIGIPGETRKDFRQTLKIIQKCQPFHSGIAIFYPYPGTRLYEKCQSLGILPDSDDHRYERTIAQLNLPEFSRKSIQKEFDFFYYHILTWKKGLRFKLRYRLENGLYPGFIRVFIQLLQWIKRQAQH